MDVYLHMDKQEQVQILFNFKSCLLDVLNKLQLID